MGYKLILVPGVSNAKSIEQKNTPYHGQHHWNVIMADMKALIKLMKELEHQVARCVRCGMCQAVCPLFEQTGRESDVARGKLALLDGLMQEMFKNPKGVSDRLDRCLLCGSCAANCPSGVSVLEIFIKARATLSGFIGLSLSKKVILRGMLAHPETFDWVLAWGSKFQKIFTRPANDLIGTSCARFVSPLLSRRHFLPLAPVPFHQMVAQLSTDVGPSGLKVAYYVGCLIDKIFPRIGAETLNVLNHHQVGVFMPKTQGCCGIPAISAGDTETFNRLVRYNLNLFDSEDFDYLVTSCATCTSTIKKIWPMMLLDNQGDVKAKARRLSEKTLDINQFLVLITGLKKSEAKKRGDTRTITYHDPCHLKKTLGVSSEPRALIQTNSRYCFEEMPGADACCGLGGSFNLQHYELSSDIGMRKRSNIKISGSSTVATGCPACMIQISDMLSRSGDRVAVKHPIEIYAEAIKLPGSGIF